MSTSKSKIAVGHLLSSLLIVSSLLLPTSCQTVPEAPLKLNIRQITSGSKHHLFGYIGQSLTTPWNASERYILSLESDFHDHMPKADEAAKIMIIDTKNDYAIEYLDETRAWNLQQGTMMYWNPESPDTQFFFNDRDRQSGKVFTVLYDIEKRERVREYRFEDTPVGNSGVCKVCDLVILHSLILLCRPRHSLCISLYWHKSIDLRQLGLANIPTE